MNDNTAQPESPLELTATHVARQWKYDASPLTACRFDPTGRYVFAAARDMTIQRWDLETDEHATLVGHDSWLRSIGFSPDGQWMYSAGYDGRLLYWEAAAESPQPVKRVTAHDGWARSLSVSPDGQWLATGGNDNLVKLWSAGDAQLVRELKGHDSHVYSTLFHPGGEFVLSGDLRGTVHQWEVASGKLVRSLDAKDLHTYHGGQRADYGGVRSMSLDSTQQRLACGGLHKATNPFGAVQEPLVLIFDWDSGEKRGSLEAEDVPKGIAWRVVYHPSGPLIGASGGGSGGFLLFWQAGDEKPVHQFKLPNTALDLDLHPNQLDLATVHYDRHIRISRMQKQAS